MPERPFEPITPEMLREAVNNLLELVRAKLKGPEAYEEAQARLYGTRRPDAIERPSASTGSSE